MIRQALLSAALLLATAAHAAGPVWAKAPNACTVLDDATAKKLLGPDARNTIKVQTNPNMTQCQYRGANGVVTVMTGDWRMIHTANPTESKIAGLGDEAYGSASGVYVRKGPIGMSVNVIVQSGSFWGVAADDALMQMALAEKKAAVALLPRL